jgi:hypothetical protein
MLTNHARAGAQISPQAAETALVAKYGEGQRARVHQGVEQVAKFWRAEDGDAAAFQEFTDTNFAGDQQTLDALFNRLQFTLESLDGHTLEIARDWRRQSDLDLGTVYPFDEVMAAYDPTAHVGEDLFQNKLALAVLLNFPLTTLRERLDQGEHWNRRQWAEARLAQRFGKRIPAEVNTEIARASAEAEQFVANYNIWMHHVLASDGRRLFPPKMRLLEHWNLRDEIKASYADPKDGLAKQRLIQQVMERIVDGSIPSEVVDNPELDWDPVSNRVSPAAVHDGERGQARDAALGRYATILNVFHAQKLMDPYSPTAPTFIDRSFDETREIPEEHVRATLQQVLSSPLAPRVAKIISDRLGRPLEPFDIWYGGFQARAGQDETKLDAITRKRYPNAEAYHADMPKFFKRLGFSPARAKYLADSIVVDPARGSGHALYAMRRGDLPHLRTRIGKDGMDYKGFNIAVHEMGHNVEQVFSLYHVDYHTLAGVPNSAVTEALAFVFQHRDMELLQDVTRGAVKAPAASNEGDAMETLGAFWSAFEIGGVALVDDEMWRWMYAHPDATPEQLRDSVVAISKDVWNRYYAPVFGHPDSTLLGVYAHMVNSPLYLSDYPIGHIIAFQIEGQMRKAGSIGAEFERMASFGNLAPDLWMKNATGSPISADALLQATERVLGER